METNIEQAMNAVVNQFAIMTINNTDEERRSIINANIVRAFKTAATGEQMCYITDGIYKLVCDRITTIINR